MKYLLDTNVVCEATAPAPNARVLGWIAARRSLDLHISVVTLAEIEEGIARLPASRRRNDLETWRDALIPSFEDRVISLDGEIARVWGALRARLAAKNRTISPMDGFIAATAERHGLVLATRNEEPFRPWGGSLANPWLEP